jgi:hypothetical protein
MAGLGSQGGGDQFHIHGDVNIHNPQDIDAITNHLQNQSYSASAAMGATSYGRTVNS